MACIGLACDALADGGPVMVVAGDTLLKPDFREAIQSKHFWLEFQLEKRI